MKWSVTRISRGFEFGTKLVFPYKSNIEHPMYPQNLYLACLLDPKKIHGIFLWCVFVVASLRFFFCLSDQGYPSSDIYHGIKSSFPPESWTPVKIRVIHGPRDWEYTPCSITSLQIKTSSNGVSLPVSNFLLFLFFAFVRGCLCIHSST